MKIIKASLSKALNAEGVFFTALSNKYIVRVKSKGRFVSLFASENEQVAIDFYDNWLKKNK